MDKLSTGLYTGLYTDMGILVDIDIKNTRSMSVMSIYIPIMHIYEYMSRGK